MRLAKGFYGLLFAVILIVFGGLLASCQPAVQSEPVVLAGETCPTPVQEAEMESIENKGGVLGERDIPPIDKLVPAQLMTATFSLG